MLNRQMENYILPFFIINSFKLGIGYFEVERMDSVTVYEKDGRKVEVNSQSIYLLSQISLIFNKS